MISNLRVEDITFRNARRQSEIQKELDGFDSSESTDVEVPNSMTPEQVKKYYEECIEVCEDAQLKRIYKQTIRWIDAMLEYKMKLLVYVAKEAQKNKSEETPDDI